MTPTQLERVGVALYGAQWRADLSRLWGINDRTLRNWMTGKGKPNAGHLAALRDHIRQRIGILNDVLIDLEASDDDTGV